MRGLFTLTIPFYCSAQNLVPNSSFEDYLKLPTKHYNGMACLKGWRAHNGNGDYYHHDAGWWTGTPRNIFGRQRPHNGKAYAGICIRTQFIEYLEIKLSEPMVRGQTYIIELFVSQAERFTGKVASVGLQFKNHICWSNEDTGIRESPAIYFNLKDSTGIKKRWIRLTSTYVADGNEQVVIIGCFQDGTSPNHKGFSHLYIDDVSIVPLKAAYQKPFVNAGAYKHTYYWPH